MLKKSNIQKYLSEKRLEQYTDYCNNDLEKALKLYQLNLRLSGAFMPLISMLEVSLRNTIDQIMEDIYPESDNKNWLEQIEFEIAIRSNAKLIRRKDFSLILSKLKKSKNGVDFQVKKNIKNYIKRKFRKDNEYKALSKEEQENRVNQIMLRMKEDKGFKIKKHVIIAKMDFSFWTALFHKKGFSLYGEKIVDAINEGKSEKVDRNKISSRLEKIKNFRNRIAHNEPIIFSKQKFDAKIPNLIKKDILFVLNLLDEDLNRFSQDIYMINRNLQDIEDYCDEISKMVE